MELLIADTAGIQPYIFGSNRLRENIGASFLVDQATGEWALDALRQVTAGCCNVRGDASLSLDPVWQIENPANGAGAEVIYTGGGNFVGLFGSAGMAQRFERALSLRILTDAPGLDLAIWRCAFDWGRDSLPVALDDLLRRLARHKQARPRHPPLAGLSVTQVCRSTGLPAVSESVKGTERRAVSAEILAKLAVTDHRRQQQSRAERRLSEFVGIEQGEFVFPRDIDDIGTTRGANSYMAVVHADGNGMGERLRQAVAAAAGGTRGQIAALRGFSEAVTDAGRAALRDMIEHLLISVDKTGNPTIRDPGLSEPIRLASETDLDDGSFTGRWFIPLRPLVFGGDDVTFVAEGRIGLALAVAFLEGFARHTADLPGERIPASACAGVAIVKASRPFAGAYALAQELCASAKTYRRERKISGGCLDWHFSSTATGVSLATLRAREYGVRFDDGAEHSLLLRPVALAADPATTSGGTWPTVLSAIQAFQQEGWSERRNKAKALRDALRGGPDAVHWFCVKYLNNGSLPTLTGGLENWPHLGWHGTRCGYFDAIEIFDRFISLNRIGASA